jgi:flagellar motor protein MotB
MARKRRLTQDHDNVGWIAYTDFVTALALVFVALFVVVVANSAKDVTIVEGDIKNAEEKPVSDCEVTLDSIRADATRFTRSNRNGGFNFVVDNLTDPTASKVTAWCPGYGSVSAEVTLVSGNRHQVPLEVGSRIPGQECDTPIGQLRCRIEVLEAELRGREGIEIEDIPGSALFPRDSYELTSEGEESMRNLAERLEDLKLLSDTTKVLAILGHTDDEPSINREAIRLGADSVDFNWTLSAQRAAAAAQFLIVKYPEYKCRIVPMGFGPSRPLEPVDTRVDDDATQRSKREKNRRLEFRVLNGNDLSAAQPSDC